MSELRDLLYAAIYNKHNGGSVSSQWTVNSILDAIMPIVAAPAVAETGALRDDVEAIIHKWDDGKNDYRGRAIILELKAAWLAAQGAPTPQNLDSTATPTTNLVSSEHSRTDGEDTPESLKPTGPASAKAVAKNDGAIQQVADLRSSQDVQVAGRMEQTFAEHTRRLGLLIAEEREKPLPNNVLIAALCDSIRLAREATVIVAESAIPPLAAQAPKPSTSPVPSPQDRKDVNDLCEAISRIRWARGTDKLDAAIFEAVRVQSIIDASHTTAPASLSTGRLEGLRRWANIGLSGLMKEHPLGEFVLLADVEAALKEVQPHPFLSAMRESPAEQLAPEESHGKK